MWKIWVVKMETKARRGFLQLVGCVFKGCIPSVSVAQAMPFFRLSTLSFDIARYSPTTYVLRDA